MKKNLKKSWHQLSDYQINTTQMHRLKGGNGQGDDGSNDGSQDDDIVIVEIISG